MALPYEHTPNIWPLLASVLFLSVMGFYAYRDRTVPGAVPFLIMVTVLLLWVMSNALELAGTHDKIRIFWFKFEKALILPAISAELCFALEYAGLDKWVTRRTVFALAILPFIFLLLILTTIDTISYGLTSGLTVLFMSFADLRAGELFSMPIS